MLIIILIDSGLNPEWQYSYIRKIPALTGMIKNLYFTFTFLSTVSITSSTDKFSAIAS